MHGNKLLQSDSQQRDSESKASLYPDDINDEIANLKTGGKTGENIGLGAWAGAKQQNMRRQSSMSLKYFGGSISSEKSNSAKNKRRSMLIPNRAQFDNDVIALVQEQ